MLAERVRLYAPNAILRAKAIGPLDVSFVVPNGDCASERERWVLKSRQTTLMILIDDSIMGVIAVGRSTFTAHPETTRDNFTIPWHSRQGKAPSRQRHSESRYVHHTTLLQRGWSCYTIDRKRVCSWSCLSNKTSAKQPPRSNALTKIHK